MPTMTDKPLQSDNSDSDGENTNFLTDLSESQLLEIMPAKLMKLIRIPESLTREAILERYGSKPVSK